MKPNAVRMTNQQVPPGTALFLIGMKVTKPWHLKAWISVFVAMPKMLAYLARHPETGILSSRLCAGPDGSFSLVSYWRSVEDIQHFAANPDAPHLPAWRWFNKALADRNQVGIWHETYEIGQCESISSGMPLYGLAAAVGRTPITSTHRTSAARMRESASSAAL